MAWNGGPEGYIKFTRILTGHVYVAMCPGEGAVIRSVTIKPGEGLLLRQLQLNLEAYLETE